jgi:putative transcriptional regulator
VSGLKTRIRELRDKFNLTQEGLAKKVGVRRETIVFIEKGDYNCSILLAHALAKELKTTLDRLFIWED